MRNRATLVAHETRVSSSSLRSIVGVEFMLAEDRPRVAHILVTLESAAFRSAVDDRRRAPSLDIKSRHRVISGGGLVAVLVTTRSSTVPTGPEFSRKFLGVHPGPAPTLLPTPKASS